MALLVYSTVTNDQNISDFLSTFKLYYKDYF